MGPGGPPGFGRNAPSVFRRPTFVIDGVAPPTDDPVGIWWPEAVSTTQEGRIQRGFTEKFGVRLRVVSLPIPRNDYKYDVVQVVQEADTLDLARNAQIAGLVSSIPAVFLIAVAFSLVLSRFVVRPIERATEIAEKLGLEPKAKDRIAVHGDDELARLGQAFNVMTDQMQSANNELEEALERQRRFTSDAAHEFRTPLTSIVLATENALHPEADMDEVRQSLEVVHRSSASLARMTELLLGLSRLDASNGKLPLESSQILPIAKEAAAIAGLSDDPRIHMEIPPDATEFRVNADAMRQILANLLSNAAAHTPKSGSIVVRQTGARIEVSDTGEGIGEEHLPRLFERFYRADPARTRTTGGHGLGLSICRALAEAQGAAIGVRSRIGEGSSFFVDFPTISENSQNPHLEIEK